MAKRRKPARIVRTTSPAQPPRKRRLPPGTLYLGAIGAALVIAAALVIFSVATRRRPVNVTSLDAGALRPTLDELLAS